LVEDVLLPNRLDAPRNADMLDPAVVDADVASVELVPVEEDEEDEEEEEPEEEDPDELPLLSPPPLRVTCIAPPPRPPPVATTTLMPAPPRDPRNWGAVKVANLSAVVDPVSRIVFCSAPVATTAVRTATIPVGPPVLAGDNFCQANQPPALTNTIKTRNRPARERGLWCAGAGVRPGTPCGSRGEDGLICGCIR
jgi:hypothetical protein